MLAAAIAAAPPWTAVRNLTAPTCELPNCGGPWNGQRDFLSRRICDPCDRLGWPANQVAAAARGLPPAGDTPPGADTPAPAEPCEPAEPADPGPAC